MTNSIRNLAPAVFVLLWSTGFIGAKLGLPYAEPATFLTLRFVLVVALFALIVTIQRAPMGYTPIQYVHLAVSGCLVHGFYLGGVFAAIASGVNAGVSALIVGIQPILTAVLVGPFLGEKVGRRQWSGFLLGFAGVALVVWENFSPSGQDLAGFGLCLVALFGISVGTVYQKHHCSDMDLRSGSMIQFLAAAVFLGCFSFTLETREIVWHGEFIFALAWLCLVLSLGAVSLLMWLIRHGAAARVSSLFYLVPPLVALESWLLFGERLGLLAVLGMICCAVGVWLVLRANTR